MRHKVSAFCGKFLSLAENAGKKNNVCIYVKLANSTVRLESKVGGYLGELIQGAFIEADREKFEFKLFIFESEKSTVESITKDFRAFIDHNWPMPNELTYPFRVFFDRAQGMIYVYDVVHKIGAIWLDTERKLDRRSFVAPFRLMFSWMGLNIDAEVIHASAIVNQGRAYVFSGPSGSGKSTLALTLADTNPIKIISDDAVIIQNGVVHALYSRAKISHNDDFTKIPIEKTFQLKETDNGKRILPLENIDRFATHGVLTAVIFPCIANAAKWTRLSTTDAVPLFLPNSLREIFQGNSRNIINHMRIISSNPCFRLELAPRYIDNIEAFLQIEQELQV
jgi:hypothetical protein